MAMKVLIVEDEELTASELRAILSETDASIEVSAVAATIEAAVKILRESAPDLIFMDIHLGDGDSFEIFRRTEVRCPVIFTTAYDQYTLKAFKNQGIDYILKPYDRRDIEQSLKKLKSLTEQSFWQETETPVKPLQLLPGSRNRFMVNLGSRIKTVNASDIAYFMAEGKYLYLFTREGESYILDETITSLEPQLSPSEFFRINRKFIIHISSIREMFKLSRNRIKIVPDPVPPDNLAVIVSEDRASLFRSWLNM